MRLPELQDLGNLQEFLQQSQPKPLLANPGLIKVMERLEHCRHSLAELDQERLVIGLLGGTGVGKSTLLNAIANRNISVSGERRPTTDRVLCYHHQDFGIPSWLNSDDLAQTPPAHDVPELRNVIILDFPDIDSRKKEHQARVHKLLPRIDLLLVVTNIDKYADRALYDELLALPHAPENLIFVLNQIDKLETHDLQPVIENFQQRLIKHSHCHNPQLLALSALTALDKQTRPHSGIDPLLKVIEGFGGDMERRAVLAANAQSFIQKFQRQLDSYLPTAEMESWFENLKAIIPAAPQASAATTGAFADSLEESIGPWLSDMALRSSGFPIGWLHFLLRRFWPGLRRGKVRDPFLVAVDPGKRFEEELVKRPHRVAQHLFAECASQLEDRIKLEAAAVTITPDQAETLQQWSAQLRQQGPRLGWKFRHHLLPLAALLVSAGSILAPLFKPNDDAWYSRAGEMLYEATSRMTPLQLGVGFLSLALYYFLIYPYFLFRLEQQIQKQARNGVDLYLKSFAKSFQQQCRDPFTHAVQTIDKWWQQLQSLRSKL